MVLLREDQEKTAFQWKKLHLMVRIKDKQTAVIIESTITDKQRTGILEQINMYDVLECTVFRPHMYC